MAAVTLITVVALSAAGQVRESVNVEVVQVPVYVTTSAGAPVPNLTKDAFQLFVDGRPQPIEYFDAVDFASAPAGTHAIERTRTERRLYLLLFDLSFATPATIDRAQRAALQSVAHSNPATDFFSIATYSSNKGVYFVSPFVSDRVAIDRAIITLKSSEANDPLGVALASRERAQWLTVMEQGGAVDDVGDLSAMMTAAGRVGGGGSEIVDMLKGGQGNQDMLAMQSHRLIEYELEGLGQVAARFAALEGQKHLVIFTEGFDSTQVTDIKAKNRPPNIDAHLLDLVKKMHETFVSAGVTLDAVDIKGLRATTNDLENDALYMLSRDTGGRVIVNRNNLVEAVDTLIQAQRIVYVLGFRQGDRKRGRISVRVNGLPRGAQVSYREGFGYTPQSNTIDSLQLADILLNDVPQSGVALKAGVLMSPGKAEVAVSFARAEVVPQLLDKSPDVEILMYIFDEHGAAVASKARRINFTGPGRVNTGYVTLREAFDLPPGKYAAKVMLRITGTKSLGFVRRDFTMD
jgi:VWFA-related protein